MGRSSSCSLAKTHPPVEEPEKYTRLQGESYPRMSPSEHERPSGRVLQKDLESLDGGRAAALGGDERRVEAHRSVRDVELRLVFRTFAASATLAENKMVFRPVAAPCAPPACA